MDGGPNRLIGLIPRSAIAALHAGPPAHVYHYKTFTIMVWNHNLLNDLGKQSVYRPRRGSLHPRLRVAGGQCPVMSWSRWRWKEGLAFC